MARVLVITDDPDFFSLLGYVLQAEGFLVSRAIRPGDIAIDEHVDPAVIILDTSENTLEICRSIVSSNKQPAATIALIRSTSCELVARLLPAGVTICVTRPFGLPRLLDILRRVAGSPGERQHPPSRLRLDRLERTVTWKDRTIPLSPIEFGLFADLHRHYGRVRLRTDLLAAGWSQPGLTVRCIDVHVCRLRRTLAPLGETFIETIRGSGYKLVAPPDN
ncbi:response regulator transcription factor [Ensifer sp. ENS07]|uniref:response regulator transcription factor n=1 Tax=Ensifer sp. ENS07 TaxID=2769274 RepID=UPI00177CC1A2|nr:response regulator transcription factor [Ensifer sp. ENS07]MBD9641710.1 response regulator transcription factor [Ensifer sp. ENS07]